MSKNLHLEFKFTDRKGRDVFEIFDAEETKRRPNSLGSIRMMPRGLLASNWASIVWVPTTSADEEAPEQLELDV